MSQQKPVTLKIERTPEELAELKAERARFSRERPGLDDLIASGEYEGPYDHGNIMALLGAVAELKRAPGRARLESRRRVGTFWPGHRPVVPARERQDPQPDADDTLALR